MISIVERYLAPMKPPSNKPLFKHSLGSVSGSYRKKRWLDKQKAEGIKNLKKKLISQHTNPMQNV